MHFWVNMLLYRSSVFVFHACSVVAKSRMLLYAIYTILANNSRRYFNAVIDPAICAILSHLQP